MPMPIIATKLYAPPPQARLTARPALWQRLAQTPRTPLLLVSAPAGFGKTTLVLEWLRQTGQLFAWLSLEPADDEPARFWRYVIAALQTVAPGVGQASLALLDTPQLPASEALVAGLINDLASLTTPLTLVLDDYHSIQSGAIQAGLNDLLDHLPRTVSLIITTREDPPLALARRRARRELLEIRAADLRFDIEEVTGFLNGAMGLGLAAGDLAALDERTEGWITGLHMVALSLQGRADKHAFVRLFAGDDRYIADYLMEEVLGHQAPALQDFLLQTAALERFSAALCDAVLERADSAALIHAIESSNLFVVPLDSRREWYRYHHLFGDLLRQRLVQSAGPAAMAALHQRASAWYVNQNQPQEAIEHALRGQDYDAAAGLMEANAGLLFLHNDLPTLVRWWQAFPVAARAGYPRLNMTMAWALLATGHPTEAGACAQAVEAALDDPAAAARLLPGQARNARLEVAVLHLSLAFSQENGEDTLALARQAEPQLAEGQIETLGPGLFNDPDSLRPVVRYGLAIGLELDGQLSAAAQAFAEAEAMARPRQNLHIQALAASGLAQLQVIQGQLHAAAATCRRALRPAGEAAVSPPSPMLGVAHGVLGLILYEWDELDAAQVQLEAGARLAGTWANAEGLLPSRVGLARVQLARGQAEAARATADDLVRQLRQSNAPALLAQAEAERARLYAETGHWQPALEWAEQRGLDATTPGRPAREAEAMALARVWLAAGQPAEAGQLCRRLAAEAQAGQRWGHLAEIRAVQALAAQAVGESATASQALGQALALAAGEGRLRLFLDLGPALRPLLAGQPVGGQPASAFVQRLLRGGAPVGPAAPTNGLATGLAEPLTERELEVLRLVEAGLTNRAIAERLVISVGTVKSHTANLFGKLGVTSRTQAAARGRALGLLPADPTNPP